MVLSGYQRIQQQSSNCKRQHEKNWKLEIYITHSTSARVFSLMFGLFIFAACRGQANKSTGFELWRYWSVECGFQSLPWHCVIIKKYIHCCVLLIGWKAIGPCVMHVEEPSGVKFYGNYLKGLILKIFFLKKF